MLEMLRTPGTLWVPGQHPVFLIAFDRRQLLTCGLQILEHLFRSFNSCDVKTVESLLWEDLFRERQLPEP